MPARLIAALVGALLALPLTLLVPAGATVDGDDDKQAWRFQRISYDEGEAAPCWVYTEKVRLKPAGGETRVFIQIRLPNSKKWHNSVRQTTLSKGRFDFRAFGKASKQYQTTYFDHPVSKEGTYHQRIVVRGDDTHRRFAGWHCTVTYGG